VAVQGFVSVWVVFPSEIDVAPVALYVLVIVLKVLLPVMVSAPAPPWFRVMPEYEMLPPWKDLAVAAVKLMVPDPVIVSPNPDDEAFHPPVPAIDQVPDPIATVAVKLAVTPDAAPERVTLYVAALNVPWLMFSAEAELALVLNASCKVTEPPGEFIEKGCENVFASLFIVWVVRPIKVIEPLPVGLLTPVPLIQLP
jgi:hypothetical protein